MIKEKSAGKWSWEREKDSKNEEDRASGRASDRERERESERKRERARKKKSARERQRSGERQKERQRERERDRQTDREKQRDWEWFGIWERLGEKLTIHRDCHVGIVLIYFFCMYSLAVTPTKLLFFEDSAFWNRVFWSSSSSHLHQKEQNSFTIATNMTSDTNCNIGQNTEKRNRRDTNLLHAVVPFLDTKGSVKNSAHIPEKYYVSNQCSRRISKTNDHTTCNTPDELGQTKVPLI